MKTNLSSSLLCLTFLGRGEGGGFKLKILIHPGIILGHPVKGYSCFDPLKCLVGRFIVNLGLAPLFAP